MFHNLEKKNKIRKVQNKMSVEENSIETVSSNFPLDCLST